MCDAFFGQYLLSNRIIDAQQLATALTAQEVLNKKLGELALEQRLLDGKQVREILALQTKEDLFFGEGAQKLGYLTQEQVDKLVKLQSRQHVCLGEVFLKLGYMTKEQRDEALTEFIFEQNKRDKALPPFSYIEAFKKERPFIEKFTAHTITILQRISGIFVKFDRYTAVKNTIELPAFSAQVDHFNEHGERVIRYIILLEDTIAQILHSKICKRNSIDENKSSRDESLCELLNIICCASCNNCQVFTHLNASVPRLISGVSSYSFDEKETAFLVSLVTPYGPLKFLLSFIWQ
ncbi:MAG: hypothetical protein L6366_05810 [Candidatus Omnitrophica bacterium]|nr:hypothetical protein [Candidatus Omnitrophota bacterium]